MLLDSAEASLALRFHDVELHFFITFRTGMLATKHVAVDAAVDTPEPSSYRENMSPHTRQVQDRTANL